MNYKVLKSGKEVANIKSYTHTQIFIEDNKRFADIALLVDNPEYIKEIGKIRNKLAIEKLFKGSLRDLERFPYTKEETQFPKSSSYKRLKNWGENVFSPKQEKYNNKELMLGLLTIQAQYLLVRFGCPYLTLRAVVASIVCDRVLDEDSVPARLDFIDQSRFTGAFKEIPALAIEITPFTTKTEMEEEFNKKQQFYKDYLAFYRHLNANLSIDTISTIKQDREWYWQKMEASKGFYLRIALERSDVPMQAYLDAERVIKSNASVSDEEYDKCERISKKVASSISYVKKSVSHYKKLINSKNFLEPQILS